MTPDGSDDLTHLLLTNDPPSALEAELAQSIITGLNRLLSELVPRDTANNQGDDLTPSQDENE